jgi:hypothetical protein
MLDWRGNLCVYVCVCMQRETSARLGELWSSALQRTAENAKLDFVQDSVLKCIAQNWITVSKSDNWISQAVPKKTLYLRNVLIVLDV